MKKSISKTFTILASAFFVFISSFLIASYSSALTLAPKKKCADYKKEPKCLSESCKIRGKQWMTKCYYSAIDGCNENEFCK